MTDERFYKGNSSNEETKEDLFESDFKKWKGEHPDARRNETLEFLLSQEGMTIEDMYDFMLDEDEVRLIDEFVSE